MKIFGIEGKLKHCAVLAVFAALLVGGCSSDHEGKDNRSNGGNGGSGGNGGVKSIACQKAEEDFKNCEAAGGPASDCAGYRDKVREVCGY